MEHKSSAYRGTPQKVVSTIVISTGDQGYGDHMKQAILWHKWLDQVTTENILVIKIDQFLSWNGQNNQIHSRVSRLLGRFQQTKPFLSTYAHIKYCNVFILPHLK